MIEPGWKNKIIFYHDLYCKIYPNKESFFFFSVTTYLIGFDIIDMPKWVQKVAQLRHHQPASNPPILFSFFLFQHGNWKAFNSKRKIGKVIAGATLISNACIESIPSFIFLIIMLSFTDFC